MPKTPARPRSESEWVYKGSEPTDDEIDTVRRWHQEFFLTLGRLGWESARDVEDQLTISLRALFAVALQRFHRELRSGALSEEDVVGQTLDLFSVMMLGGVKVEEPPSPGPDKDVATFAVARPCATAVRAMPEALARVGWLHGESDVAAVMAVVKSWGAWSDRQVDSGKAPFYFPVPPFLHELITGWPERRPENFPSRAEFEEYMAASLSSRVSMGSKSLRDLDKDGSGFRRLVELTLKGVNEQADVRARTAASKIRETTGQRNDPDVIKTNIVSQLLMRGHRVPYGFPQPDGTVLAHENTLIGINKVQRDMDELGEHGEGNESLDAREVDADRDDRLARIDDLSNSPAAQEDAARRVLAACERARSAAADDPTARAALEYVIAKAQWDVGQCDENPTRAAFAARFGVPDWRDDRSAAEKSARRGLRAAFEAEGLDVPDDGEDAR